TCSKEADHDSRRFAEADFDQSKGMLWQALHQGTAHLGVSSFGLLSKRHDYRRGHRRVRSGAGGRASLYRLWRGDEPRALCRYPRGDRAVKVKLDENLGHAAADLFRQAGHDVEMVRTEGLSGCPD